MSRFMVSLSLTPSWMQTGRKAMAEKGYEPLDDSEEKWMVADLANCLSLERRYVSENIAQERQYFWGGGKDALSLSDFLLDLADWLRRCHELLSITVKLCQSRGIGCKEVSAPFSTSERGLHSRPIFILCILYIYIGLYIYLFIFNFYFFPHHLTALCFGVNYKMFNLI